jgi:pimeloyl-ACP methyl ester carboxylesterase
MDKRVTEDSQKGIDRTSQLHRLADGRGIGFAEFGDPDGMPVIALHGTPGSRFMFALTDEPARARKLRIIAHERPGYGLSEFHRFETLADTASDVEALADALGLDRFALIGMSGGGPHAVAAAHLLKSRILRLVLVSSVGPIAECDHIRMSHLHRMIFSQTSHHASATFFSTLRTLMDWAPSVAYQLLMQQVTATDCDVLNCPEVRDNLQAALREGLRTGTDGALQDLNLYSVPWNVTLAEVDVPAFMWQGGEDTVVPPDAAYYLAGALPNCQLEVIEGAGHYWVFGEFDRVLDKVRATWP